MPRKRGAGLAVCSEQATATANFALQLCSANFAVQSLELIKDGGHELFSGTSKKYFFSKIKKVEFKPV